MDDRTVLTATDDTYAAGKIGLVADVPTLFEQVAVTTTSGQSARTAAAIAERERTGLALQAANPRPVLWKSSNPIVWRRPQPAALAIWMATDGSTSSIGQVEHHGPKDRNSELSCLTAMTLEGNVLWQIGEPDSWKQHLTNDVAFQIHDLNGDGRGEVVYAMHQELIIAEGATGKTKLKIPTPNMPATAEPVYQTLCVWRRIVLRRFPWHGAGHGYRAQGPLLSLLGVQQDPGTDVARHCNTGHYPIAADVDGDGRDELAIGYSLFDHAGKQLWTWDNELKDHTDGMAVVRMAADPKAEPRIFLLCQRRGGLFCRRGRGRISPRHRIGHAQNPAVANFRDDLPGLEVLSMSFWATRESSTSTIRGARCITSSSPASTAACAFPPTGTAAPRSS